MADYVATSSMSLEAAITAGAMTNGDNLTINNGAVITCTQTPSILIGNVIGNSGELFIDGINISAGNSINFVGEYQQSIASNAGFTLRTEGAWFNIGTTDGTDSQTFDLSSTGVDYWNSDFCVDVIPMIQVETGRRIDFDNASGDTPSVGDYLYKTSDDSVMGRIDAVESTYIVVHFLTGSLANDDAIEVRSLANDGGPNYRVIWTAQVNNVSGDIKEAGVYQEFGNCRSNGTNYMSSFHNGIGGFLFDNAHQSTTITMGGASGGFVPPSGCNVRVPNIHFSTSNTTQYALGNTYHDGSATESNWYEISTGGIGNIDCSITNFGITWVNCGSVYLVTMDYCGLSHSPDFTASPNAITLTHCVLCQDPVSNARVASTTPIAFGLYVISDGSIIEDCMLVQPIPSYGFFGASQCKGVTINRFISTQGNITGDTAGVYMMETVSCEDCVFDDIVLMAPSISSISYGLYFINDTNCTFKNLKIGTQDGSAGVDTSYFLRCETCNGLYVCGLDLINEFSHAGGSLFYVSQCSNLKFRCFGRIIDKLDLKSNMTRWIILSGANRNLDFSRLWAKNPSSATCYLFSEASTGIKLFNASSSYDSLYDPSSLDDVQFRGVHSGSGTPGSTTGINETLNARYGNQMHDGFKSDTSGFMVCVFYAPSSVTSNVTITSGSPEFKRDGTLDMISGDVLEAEFPYFLLGHVAFTGDFTAVIGSSAWYADEWANVDVDFQYDLGSGYNGSWLDARTPTNLISISGSHEMDIDNVSGTFNVGDSLSWGTGGTAGTGLVSSVTGSHLDLILTSGVVPSNDLQITDDDTSATCDVNGAVTDSSVMVDGIKIKFRFTATDTQTGMSMFILDTTTTLQDQANNLYPIDQDYVTVKVTVKDISDYSLIEGARVLVEADSGGDLAVGTDILTGLTNSSGYIQTTEFLYTNDQPVTVKIRKASSTPLYKPALLSGTISSNGLNITGLMISDE